MAIQTRRPGGNWTTVQSYTTYSNVIANYASALQQVQENADNLEIERKLMEYKNGNATYQDVVNLFNKRLATALPNSQKELDLRQSLIEVQNYEDKKNRDIKRSQLEAKFAKGGISAQERLQIEKELLATFKEGTSDYSEQLANIATSTELANQEIKNQELSKMQAQLSEGGLTTDEEIKLYEKGQKLSDPGSQEYATFSQKLNEAKQQKEQEDIEKQANEKYLELLDKYKAGGVTNDENLQIVREMLNIYKPGTKEYTKMKESEADLLGAIAKEGVAGGKKALKAETEKQQVEFSALESRLENLQNQFDIGAISVQDFLKQQQEITDQQNTLITANGDILEPKATGELQARTQVIEELRNKIQSGQAVVVKIGSKEQGIYKQAIVPLDQLKAYAKTYEIQPAEVNGRRLGKPEEGDVVTIIENGEEKQVLLTKNGGLEYLDTVPNKDDTVSYRRSGQPVSFKSSGLVTPTQQNLVTKNSMATGDVLGASTSAAVVHPGESKSSGKSSSSSKSSAASNLVKAATTANKIASTASAVKNTVSQVSSAIQKSGPTAGAYGSNKILGSGIKPGNIKGTIDIGVTEALGIGKLVNKVKSVLGNLFKKR